MCAILACSMLTPVFMLTGCGSEKDGVKRLKLSINTNQSQVDMAEAMAEKIEELSDGKMAIDIYGDGQLGGRQGGGRNSPVWKYRYVCCFYYTGSKLLSRSEFIRCTISF